MKILYICAFLMDVLAISILAFRFLEGLDSGSPAWMQMSLAIGLIFAISLLVVFIREYLKGSK